jgi:hypothetical protein
MTTKSIDQERSVFLCTVALLGGETEGPYWASSIMGLTGIPPSNLVDKIPARETE